MDEKYCSIMQIYILSIPIYLQNDRYLQINSQDIEHKQNSDIDQGP